MSLLDFRVDGATALLLSSPPPVFIKPGGHHCNQNQMTIVQQQPHEPQHQLLLQIFDSTSTIIDLS